ncbi:MAG: DUF1330 domain-containing protein [Rhizobiaceae bacterium]|nr:DUF1330 domain-containing protein [Hyphomicrobiales bacterium]NRB31942.1 DUF1330 domain-containing protein [Rhizobiaceae bacterium]
MRNFLFLVTLFSALITPLAVQAQGLHFISVAWIPAEKQAQYDAFSRQVIPIWQRHGMTPLLRAKVIGALAAEEGTKLPTEIAILRVASRQDFENYIADPDYRAIRKLRTDAVEQMIVLEGTPALTTDNPILATAPQFAMTFDLNEEADGTSNLVFDMPVTLVGSIKGEASLLFNAKPHIGLFALSYDDNPMSFVSGAESNNPVFILQRHLP